MAQWYKFVLYYLWVAPHVFLAVVVVLMFAQRLYKTFRIFFLYCLYEIIAFLILFIYRDAVNAPTWNVFYRYFFIATLAGSAALRFGVIQEIFNHVFRDYARLETLATNSIRWLTILLFLAAIVTAFYSSGRTAFDSLMAGVGLLNRGVAIIQAGLLLFLFWFSRMFGLSLRGFAFGIALGFGVLASTDLAVSATRLADVPADVQKLLNLLPTGSYHVSVLVWLGYLLAAEKPAGAATCPVPELDQWSAELKRSR